MSGIGIGLLLLLLAGIALGAYALAAPRRKRVPAGAKNAPAPLRADNGWTAAAGNEFDGLSESSRCDMLFAVAALEDDRSHALLSHALADPSEAVALAAAHALASRGHAADVERFLADHPGERADRLAHTLALLDPQARGSA